MGGDTLTGLGGGVLANLSIPICDGAIDHHPAEATACLPIRMERHRAGLWANLELVETVSRGL